ncbi:hypothetical protein ABZ412_34100 [Nocardia sp. NPDC005746]|uniref:hypothetical protein n=1 Tax=Nocardia sp. NPDC005746 TaxID=3157062 RepID=UPI0033C4CC53
MRTAALPFAATAAALLLAGCGTAEDQTSAAPGSTTAPAAATTSVRPTATVPAYEVKESGQQFTALVRTDDTAELSAAFREIARKVLDGTYRDGGYTVRFDCAIDYDPAKSVNRLGTGKIARGTLGAAQTGLRAGQYTIDFNTGRTCREGAPTTTFDPARQLDHDYAVELCLKRIEEKYVADQRPVTLSGVNVTEADGKWTVTAVAQGAPKPGMGSTAAVDVSCVSQPNPLRTELTKFTVR